MLVTKFEELKLETNLLIILFAIALLCEDKQNALLAQEVQDLQREARGKQFASFEQGVMSNRRHRDRDNLSVPRLNLE